MSDGLCSLDWQRMSLRSPLPLEDGRQPLRIADLFSGCGGLSLGAMEAARAAGIPTEVRFAIDNFQPATSVYKANFNSVASNIECADIEKHVDGELGAATLTASERKLCTRVGRLHLLLAGPPCQGHSDLNNHSRRKDDRNKLYLRVARFAEIFSPEAVIIENVRNVIHDKYGVVRKSIKSLDRDYDVREFSISAKDLGISQSRTRHILVAVRKACNFDFSGLFQKALFSTTLRDVIGDLVDEYKKRDEIFYTPSRMQPDNLRRVRYLFQHNVYDLPNEERPDCHRTKPHTYTSVYGRLSWEKPAQTITTGFGSMGQGRYVHPARPRVITPHEAARIQGFPDFFDFSAAEKRTYMQTLIGNAVPPVVAAIPIFRLITQGVFGFGGAHGPKEEEKLSA